MSRKYVRSEQEYETDRRNDAKNRKTGLLACYRTALRLAPAGTNAHLLAAAMVCMVVKAQYDLSYRDLATHIETHEGVGRICSMKKTPSKSKLHAMSGLVSSAGPEFLHDVLAATAGKDARGDLVGDSTGMTTGMYKRWYDAKYGDGSRKEFVKLHILANPYGKIVGFEVTEGTVHDSPVFRRILARLPRGSGTVMLDAAYDANENCKMIVDSGRVPVIAIRKNANAKGYNARARMCKWAKERPGEYELAYNTRSLVESIFSSLKRRTGAFVRARSLPTRTVEIFAKVLCYNMTA